MKHIDPKDRNLYFNEIYGTKTLEDLGEEPDDFEAWCFWKHTEIKIKTNIRNLQNELSVVELRDRCCSYASDVSWAIEQFYIIDNKIKKIEQIRIHWYNRKHLYALQQLKKQGNSAPSIKSIDAYIEYHFTHQWNYWENRIQDLKGKKKILEEHKTLWFKLDKILTTMIYDVNSEWYRTARDVEQRVKGISSENQSQSKHFPNIQPNNTQNQFNTFLKEAGVENEFKR